jgi:hypothetical protein
LLPTARTERFADTYIDPNIDSHLNCHVDVDTGCD